METIVFIGLGILVLGIVLAIFIRQSQIKNPGPYQLMQQLLEEQGRQLQNTTNLVLQQLGQHQQSQERTSNLMHTRIDQATKVVTDVHGKLLQLEEANKRIFELGKDISGLQKILQAPKLRGSIGEIWLADLIGQILPADRYKIQHTFKTGETCDAVIFLRDGMLLPIDSKFSLENFVKMMEVDELQRPQFKRLFMADIKKRIDEIARKYILPQEGTLDLAFMYVPAENVYYQAFIQADEEMQLLSYAFERKVIPVSPSSIYPYLQVILLGLRGMEIEKSAKQIQKNLSGLQGDFQKFRETYEKVGGHLRHAQQSYDQSDKRLYRIDNSFLQITDQEEIKLQIPDEIE